LGVEHEESVVSDMKFDISLVHIDVIGLLDLTGVTKDNNEDISALNRRLSRVLGEAWSKIGGGNLKGENNFLLDLVVTDGLASVFHVS